ncbi:large subunit GTPase 1 homolog [Caerostris extrusa]|uniref:Large subunit GTPase 1 homolog n=1 Tax=Caerostris extrusa TaxID=172846 RepID=A0AAV4U2X9_CAEEX|nr:large subunit GTPase 1 homolog [Caerostris extrusa]
MILGKGQKQDASQCIITFRASLSQRWPPVRKLCILLSVDSQKLPYPSSNLKDFSKIKIVDPDEYDQIPNEEEMAAIHEENKEILCIPRRPPWDLNLMNKKEIDENEKEACLRVLDEKKIEITPFEKNLEVWRQLWRVLERSDVVIQILDARNPLLYRCLDLEAYVKEIEDKKINILLLNKADLLNESQRKYWCDYFDEMGMKVIFFSALLEGELIWKREELLEFFRQTCKANNVVQSSVHIPTIGLVGYPNVGKSSTLNALLKAKKTCVSATPGKTKHFQTFIVSQDLCLCDCPGRSPTAEEFLDAFGYSRGFMTHRGLPDNARSARVILKDYNSGKLLFCHAPPDVKQEEYHEFPEIKSKKSARKGNASEEIYEVSETLIVFLSYSTDICHQY